MQRFHVSFVFHFHQLDFVPTYTNNFDRSQTIRLLIAIGFLAIPEDSQVALFNSFNNIPTEKMGERKSPVTQAVFAKSFNYVRIAAINYSAVE